jgi:hypothetical protein
MTEFGDAIRTSKMGSQILISRNYSVFLPPYFPLMHFCASCTVIPSQFLHFFKRPAFLAPALIHSHIFLFNFLYLFFYSFTFTFSHLLSLCLLFLLLTSFYRIFLALFVQQKT